MGMILNLCSRTLLLKNGFLIADGASSEIVAQYLSTLDTERNTKGQIQWLVKKDSPHSDEIIIQSISIMDLSGDVRDVFTVDEPIFIEIDYIIMTVLRGMRILVSITTEDGQVAFHSTDQNQRSNITEPGHYKSTVEIPPKLLNLKRYSVGVAVDIPGINILLPWQEYLRFYCKHGKIIGEYIPPNWAGVLAPQLQWNLKKI
jgi:hypothetical protein